MGGKIKVTQLNKESLLWIREALSVGRSLSKHIRIDLLDSGYVYTPTLEKESLLDLYNFDQGLGNSETNRYIESWTENLVRDKLSDKNTVLFLENSLSNSSDAWLKKSKTKTIFFGKDVFHFATSTSKKDELHKVFVEASSIYPPTVGIISYYPESKLNDRDSLNEKQLTQIVDKIKYILILSYDGERYLIWSQQKLTERL